MRTGKEHLQPIKGDVLCPAKTQKPMAVEQVDFAVTARYRTFVRTPFVWFPNFKCTGCALGCRSCFVHAAHTRAQVVLEPLISLADERSITHAISESSPHLHPDATAGVLRPAAAAAACATVAALGGRVEPRGIAQSLDRVLVQDPPQ